MRHLAVADGLVAAGVGGQDAAQGAAAAAVHQRVAREGAVQVLLDLHVPVVGGRVPRLRAAVRPPAHSTSVCTGRHTLQLLLRLQLCPCCSHDTMHCWQ